MGISKKEKVSYGLGAVGKDMVYALVSGFLLYYFNTVLGISATFIGMLFMFAVPKGLSHTYLLIYVSVAYILWGVTYTIMDIPYWSMIPAITSPGKDREQMSVIARSCAGVGLDVIKLDTNAVEQTSSTLLGLRILMIVIPMIGLVGSMIFLSKKYKLDEDMMDKIKRELV